MPFAIPTQEPRTAGTSRLRDFAFSFTVVALGVWLLGLVLGFFATSLVTLTPANWPTWVWVRLALQVGGGLLVGLGLFINPKVRFFTSLVCTVLFAAIGSLFGLNALRALGGPRRVEGTVVAFRQVHTDSAFNEGYNETRVELRQADGANYVLDLSGGSGPGVLADLFRGCSRRGDRVALTVLQPLDAPLALRCLEHVDRVTGRNLSTRKTYTEGMPIVVHYEGLPGNPHDWVTVYPSDAHTGFEKVGIWSYTGGKKSGDYQVPPQPPGRYEASVYFNDAIANFPDDSVTFQVLARP